MPNSNIYNQAKRLLSEFGDSVMEAEVEKLKKYTQSDGKTEKVFPLKFKAIHLYL